MPKTILVVDDQASLRQMVRFALQLQGYNVLDAEDGVVALDLLDTHDVDLLVTDWKMPNMDGLELLQRVRRSDRYQDLPVIMVSCVVDAQARYTSYEEQVIAWLKKPFRIREIQTAVEMGLNCQPAASRSVAD